MKPARRALFPASAARPGLSAFATFSPQLLGTGMAGARQIRGKVNTFRLTGIAVMSLVAAFRAALSRFRREEDGALIIFALILFCMMVMIGGMAVDFMRYEWRRTALQNTLDRGVLAAAAMSQKLDREAVVRDYFDKSAIKGDLQSVDVVSTLNGSEVTATGAVDINPYFLHWVGIEDLAAHGVSAAEQRVNNVEIVLVLDVSGSMASNNRLVNLKAAAKEFVDTILASDSEDRISIALVPFNGQVNLGSTLRAKYNATDIHGTANVNCLDLPAAAYSGISLSRSLAMPMTPYADSYSTTNQTASFVSPTNSYATPYSANVWCPATPGNIVRLPTNDGTTLKAQIDGLTAIGATSINAGMRWGTALLDPGSRGMYDELIGAGQMNADWSGRPFDYDDDEAMKVIVLMTDGEHFAEERFNDGYRTGASPIWRSSGDGNYSVQIPTGRPAAAGSKQYWVPHLCTSNSCRNGTNTAEAWRAAPWTNNSTAAVQQDWVQVWANLRVSYVAWQFYARALGTSATRSAVYDSWMNTFRTQTATSSMDTQLQGMCDLAKAQNVTIYGIAFEAPTGGQTQIAGCASSSAHYFNATGIQISTAFNAIATNITQLRLTQ
jgi:Flp pilus assembly protein TadG